MASEFSEQLAKKLDAPAPTFLTSAVVRVIDAELQEVREVLVSTARHKDSYGLPCWCVVMMQTLPHMEHCQRARTLMDKLEIR
jgi:hypothetical protein